MGKNRDSDVVTGTGAPLPDGYVTSGSGGPYPPNWITGGGGGSVTTAARDGDDIQGCGRPRRNA